MFPFNCPSLECLRVTGHDHTKNDLSELLTLVLSSQELKLKALDLQYTVVALFQDDIKRKRGWSD